MPPPSPCCISFVPDTRASLTWVLATQVQGKVYGKRKNKPLSCIKVACPAPQWTVPTAKLTSAWSPQCNIKKEADIKEKDMARLTCQVCQQVAHLL